MTRAEFEALINEGDYDEVWLVIEQGNRDREELEALSFGKVCAMRDMKDRAIVAEARAEKAERNVVEVMIPQGTRCEECIFGQREEGEGCHNPEMRDSPRRDRRPAWCREKYGVEEAKA